MRLANIEEDFWELMSAEVLNKENPDTFWIPKLEERKNLQKGQAAKLIFKIEIEDEGKILSETERMWVIISERLDNGCYIGILDNKPAFFDPSDDVYLCFGAEIPFSIEHIIDIGNPPKEYSDWQLKLPPERLWDRES
jgi:hypothetical protein